VRSQVKENDSVRWSGSVDYASWPGVLRAFGVRSKVLTTFGVHAILVACACAHILHNL
jgi:hypothetical protein